jgi:DNA-binding CsgD family transcriptional regulator
MFLRTQDPFPKDQSEAFKGLNFDLSWFQALADNVSYGIGLVSINLEVIFINKQAKITLATYGESIAHNSLLNCGSPTSQMTRLITAVRQARDGTKQIVLFQKETHQCAIAVSPIELGFGKTYVLITPERINNCDRLSLMSYGRMLGLTNAEIRVLERLSDGQGPTEVAQTLQVSVPTIRTHIKSILGKTNSACLRSLLLRVSKLPPLSINAGSGSIAS